MLNGRDFPWRHRGTSPFAFLVTEMLLRQTRASSVAQLWNSFLEDYPDAHSLSKASLEELEGKLRSLGFGKQRSIALHSMATWLVDHHNGDVPTSLDELIQIPHIGPYAAHAVLCFAFGKPTPIVDINILRFLARYYGLEVKPDIRRNPVIWELARSLLPSEETKVKQHNYGLLDFTAEICKPGRPRCEICPLITTCEYGSRHAKDYLPN